MTDEQLRAFAAEEPSLTSNARMILQNEIKSRNIIIDHVKIHESGIEAIINESENTILPQYNTSLLEKVIIDFRDGKTREEIIAGIVESDWDPGKAALLAEAAGAIAKKRLGLASTAITMGIFIFLAGMAIHLINPSRFNISPAGILASCALLVGGIKIFKGVSDRRKYSLVIKNIYDKSEI